MWMICMLQHSQKTSEPIEVKEVSLPSTTDRVEDREKIYQGIWTQKVEFK
jgi:hypothetical protein